MLKETLFDKIVITLFVQMLSGRIDIGLTMSSGSRVGSHSNPVPRFKSYFAHNTSFILSCTRSLRTGCLCVILIKPCHATYPNIPLVLHLITATSFCKRQKLSDTLLCTSRKSWVSVVTRLRSRQSGIRILAGTRDFPLLHKVHTKYGAHPPSTEWVPGSFYPRIKQKRREADFQTPRGAMGKNKWRYTSTPPCTQSSDVLFNTHNMLLQYMSSVTHEMVKKIWLSKSGMEIDTVQSKNNSVYCNT
jgi:hypothetical protein